MEVGSARPEPQWVPRPPAWRVDVVLSIAAPALFLAVAGYQRRWMSDDGFINMRVVQNLLEGNGPVFNAGERVEVATSPLWVYLVAAANQLWRVELEHLFIALGVVCTAGGLVAAGCGAVLIQRRARRHFWLPAGAVVYAVLTPAWDFTTSGLDGSLAVAWIGVSVLLLAQAEYRPESPGAMGAAFVIGLAPLVRPDLVVMGAVLFVALLGLEWRRGWRRVALLFGVGAAVPVLYQLFRMGYYGIIVPNTALAKEATQWRSDQGYAYLDDFTTAFGLGLPLYTAVALGLIGAVVAVASNQPRRLFPLVAPMVAGVLHGAYVVAVGGDFMSARLLLPTVFALVAPVSVAAVPLPRRRWLPALALTTAPVVVIGVWAYLCANHYGLRYERIGPKGIADERDFYIDIAQHDNPVLLDDYALIEPYRIAETGRTLVERRHHVVCVLPAQGCATPAPQVAVRWRASAEVVLSHGNIGVPGAGTPLTVHVADRAGLGDPLGARVYLHTRGRPGHEKDVPPEWVYARFAEPGQPIPHLFDVAKYEAAQTVLACPQWQEIERSVTEKLTPSRFFKNLFGAFGRSQLRVDTVNPPTDCRFSHG